ncbi:methyl-accepting chemotaxis protein [Inconstantimicrobium mannanitabidum]|uniref:Methyl-accepting chemotaxis protein n=1 Tax=Inconstantimicrobium mannanitabidum TaxID=1604901 RepID=A0ACB5R813_9CLOT|nr:methyl-accepting chemotaxis protein [Clostridium sp. TW13]GKX65166.1 methyl-accepting chemotaxis protein [Clostridium sp. TW13]
MYNQELEPFLKVAPVIKDMLQEDIMIVVTDTTKFIYYSPGYKLDTKISIGIEIPTNGAVYKALKSGEISSAIISKEAYGIPFKSISYPVKDSNGNVIGVVCIGKSLEEQYKVEESTDTLFSSLEETSASVEEISSGSEKLLNIIGNLVETSKETEKQIKESNEIISLMQNIASKSNLLGLNAAIEAARSGEQGKGFAVVASEMRKLAQLSSESSQKVSNALFEISKSTEEVFKIINEVQSISETQAAATEEITATLEEVTASAQTVVEIAKVK